MQATNLHQEDQWKFPGDQVNLLQMTKTTYCMLHTTYCSVTHWANGTSVLGHRPGNMKTRGDNPQLCENQTIYWKGAKNTQKAHDDSPQSSDEMISLASCQSSLTS